MAQVSEKNQIYKPCAEQEDDCEKCSKRDPGARRGKSGKNVLGIRCGMPEIYHRSKNPGSVLDDTTKIEVTNFT